MNEDDTMIDGQGDIPKTKTSHDGCDGIDFGAAHKNMKIKLIVCGIILLAIRAATLSLHFGGVTHERIYDRVTDVSGEIREKIDDRYRALEQKLSRLEGKLGQDTRDCKPPDSRQSQTDAIANMI